MRYAVIVRGTAVGAGAPSPGAVAPHPDAARATGQAAGQGADADGRPCSATTKAGDPCKGRAGDDGFCAAHKEA